MINFANPRAQFLSYQAEIEEAVLRVVRGPSYILGKECDFLEEEFANYIGTDSAVGVANGTDALEIALRSLDVGYGDEVVTVSHTAVATIAAIEASGASAVLLDVGDNSFNLDVELLEQIDISRVKAVIAVHLYGHPCDMVNLVDFCQSNNISLIEDVSQGHGATYGGRKAGSIGDIGCFSCYPTKNLGAIGDAGLITANEANGLVIKKIREYGWENRESILQGRNSRLDEIQAAILRIKLKHLDSDNEKRRIIARRYIAGLRELPIQLPKFSSVEDSVFHLFVIQVENREALLAHLSQCQINCGIHYPTPVHLQPAYLNRIRVPLSMSNTEVLAQRIISLPIYPELSLLDVDVVISSIKNFYEFL